MKLSIAWIFDHIDVPWKTIDIPALVAQCNQTTAEIEHYYPISISLDQFSLARVEKVDATVLVYSPEWKKEISLPLRPGVEKNQWYMIKNAAWASMKDWSSEKEHLLPALSCPESLQAGSWKKQFECDDYIIELDNKSITHRPDLWGHRGFAREVAAMLNIPLKPLSQFIEDKPVKEYDQIAPAASPDAYTVINKVPQACRRFTALSIPTIENNPSLLWMAHRLARVDARSIDALVDMTNYVMLDLSQPMHAFDGAALRSKIVEPRFAKDKETLSLLDGSKITLTNHDLVITDGEKPIALAGIMGGSQSGVQLTTHSLFLESACFDPSVIRLSSQRHKLRTEASARFEKTLDPQQTTQAIMRYLKLLRDAHIQFTAAEHIVACGALPKPIVITLTHDYIEKRIGVLIEPIFIMQLLKNLEFSTQYHNGSYTIHVPRFRATKDVAIKEDIVEEIARFVGYTTIKPTLPTKQLQTSDLHPTMQLRAIKRSMAYTLSMRELYNYALYDEEFLRTFDWDPKSSLSVQNPVSEHWRRPVTSLIPHLLKAVMHNAAEHDNLRFFEWGRTWHQDNEQVNEKKVLAGIFFAKSTIDFYQAKKDLEKFFDALSLPVTWQKVDNPGQAWFRPYQTADILYHNRVIGRAGSIHQLCMQKISEGDAFIFDLDGDFLQSYKKPLKKFVQLSRYPDVMRDISMMIPNALQVDDIIAAIKKVDERITLVSLIDFFEKEEWLSERSITIRCVIQDMHKTLTKDEVDTMMDRVQNMLKSMGATIR